MKQRISNQFLANYLIMFIISIMIAILALILMDFANHVLSDILVKNNYTAESLMQDDYSSIDTSSVIENGGGVQVIDSSLNVVLSKGLDTLKKNKLTAGEFTKFLMAAGSKGIPFSYNIEYNPVKQFWLIVTFPTSLRIDFAIVHNEDYPSADSQNVTGAIAATIMFFLLLLALSTIVYSKITSIGIVNPLRKLCSSVQRLKDGDYSSRVNLNLKNEFGELQDTFNAMAEQIEQEIILRKQSEENRRRLVLDISHDLKNPLSSVMGYAELCMNRKDISEDEKDACMKIIYENSVRANNLITGLFELSKLESPEFTIEKSRVDICEYVREQMGAIIPMLDNAGFTYDFDIPEEELTANIDTKQMDRVFQNLVSNTVKYNSKGTKVTVSLFEQGDEIIILFKDDGIGIPVDTAKDIFMPFVRAGNSENSAIGGTGLGLAIVDKIIKAHGGSISLRTDTNKGCEFAIKIPRENLKNQENCNLAK